MMIAKAARNLKRAVSVQTIKNLFASDPHLGRPVIYAIHILVSLFPAIISNFISPVSVQRITIGRALRQFFDKLISPIVVGALL